MSSKDNDILSALISHKRDIINIAAHKDLSMPLYISQLFEFRCSKMKNLEIDLKEFKQITKTLKIDKLCLNGRKDMIDINLLVLIFGNIEILQLMVPNNFVFSDEIVRYLYDNLYRACIRRSQTLKVIEIRYPSNIISYSLREKMTSELQDDFDNIGWAVSIETNDSDEESIYFTKFNAQFNPHYKALSAALQTEPISFDGAQC